MVGHDLNGFLSDFVDSLAKIIVYSMCLDSPIRGESGSSDNSGVSTPQNGFIGGSRALDSLDKLITSTESYFHPSNHGHWTLSVSSSAAWFAVRYIDMI